MSQGRYFDSPNCGCCMYKGSSYCWGQCSFNIWKKGRDWCFLELLIHKQLLIFI